MAHTNFKKFGINFYADEEEINAHLPEVEKLITEITNKLSKYPNFESMSFSDVSAGYIQLNLNHKAIPGYHFIILELSHDWDNIDELIESAVSEWEENDIPDKVNSYKSFIDFGNKYGWD